ncbi:non-hydrolyzing UDP-N-acetylglucosamine 2-epimerase [Microvirga thermotolerans]|uniref:UDP-N-acetylglucosamine 2-epimerase (non-hydrolyzing) n=1 Tax=Microvirga thermotolerans TaxID=2651334 RepID=A0A5P9JZI9_9HYPH|nr:UDP-N-acetylglucosamine 2-epimerase (non-hydrolyzing) [Microvirga thermotolerans]QFU17863.1 UDP-N-acetylglucosamine 2-epimerase (non-hydrolyzing) [Microvirga thermotolerans]
MQHVLVVFGTRPEAIKMLPVVRALRESGRVSVSVAITGQHRQMLDQVFEVFEERPDIDLNLMTHDQKLPDITASILSQMAGVLGGLRPDLVLVHGDTTTAMATAVAAFYNRVPIGHVEAGLRSFDLARPWPEEFNRVAIDSLAEYLFAPTTVAAENLDREYSRRGRVFITGNTGIDALLHVSRKIEMEESGGANVLKTPVALDPERSLVLVTGHRRESFGAGFEGICAGLAKLARRSDIEIVYPVHMNPSVREVVHSRLGGLPNVHLIDPVSYVDMIRLMKRAKVILTDSGGIQEEGPALGRPVLVMRDTTERPEAIATGTVSLVGTDPIRIHDEVSELLDDEQSYRKRARAVFPYGDGTASTQIAKIISESFCA